MSNNRNDDAESLARVFGALSNVKRLELFAKLAQVCGFGAHCCTNEDVSLCVEKLARELRLATSTVSHHLKELRMAGLIRIHRRGKFNEFQVDPAILRKLARFLGGCCGPTRRKAKKTPTAWRCNDE